MSIPLLFPHLQKPSTGRTHGLYQQRNHQVLTLLPNGIQLHLDRAWKRVWLTSTQRCLGTEHIWVLGSVSLCWYVTMRNPVLLFEPPRPKILSQRFLYLLFNLSFLIFYCHSNLKDRARNFRVEITSWFSLSIHYKHAYQKQMISIGFAKYI